jgi:hypothetical protein
MKKIELGQMLAILANFGVIVGILLLVYELKQARDFARTEFQASNKFVFQEIERDMMNPDVAAVWAKAAVDPGSLTNAEVRVMDAFLISLYNYWRQQWIFEKEGFISLGETEAELMVDVPFYLGSTFAQVWWEDLKSSHMSPEDLEFDALVGKALADADPSANQRYLERIQRRIQERVSDGGE